MPPRTMICSPSDEGIVLYRYYLTRHIVVDARATPGFIYYFTTRGEFRVLRLLDMAVLRYAYGLFRVR